MNQFASSLDNECARLIAVILRAMKHPVNQPWTFYVDCSHVLTRIMADHESMKKEEQHLGFGRGANSQLAEAEGEQ